MAFSASLAAGIKKSADYHETIAIFENTIDKYRKYFAGFSSSLSEAEEQGLCGELLFLRKLISEYGSKAVKWWLGPDKNKRDFVLEDFSAEVKTTLGQKETVITVANENQLDNSGTARLILVVYVLEKNACGNVCVSGLIREISGMLTDVGDYQLFFRKLENAGIKQGVYTDKNIYTVQNSVKYLVNNNFPCIRKKDLPDQIFDVKYRLNLSTLSRFIIKD